MLVRNWEKWQSYRKDRGQPPWIKIHRELMRNLDWVSLSDAAKGHLVSIWLLAADRNGKIPDDPGMIAKLCFLDTPPDLEALVRVGFLERDATVTPIWRQHDPPEERRGETEETREETLAHAREEISTPEPDGPDPEPPDPATETPGQRAGRLFREREEADARLRDAIDSADDVDPVIHPTQRLSASQVLHAWESLQPSPVPEIDRRRQRGFATKIADSHTAAEVAAAFAGIQLLFPHSAPKSEPWDLSDLDRKFAKALAKAQDHPSVRARRFEDDFLTRTEGVA